MADGKDSSDKMLQSIRQTREQIAQIDNPAVGQNSSGSNPSQKRGKRRKLYRQLGMILKDLSKAAAEPSFQTVLDLELRKHGCVPSRSPHLYLGHVMYFLGERGANATRYAQALQRALRKKLNDHQFVKRLTDVGGVDGFLAKRVLKNQKNSQKHLIDAGKEIQHQLMEIKKTYGKFSDSMKRDPGSWVVLIGRRRKTKKEIEIYGYAPVDAKDIGALGKSNSVFRTLIGKRR